MKKNVQQQTLKLLGALVLGGAISASLGLAASATETKSKPAITEAQKRPDQAIADLDKASDWKEPEKVLSELTLDGLPITEVGEMLRKQFDNGFDVLFPFGQQQGWDWTSTPITLRLKGVTASEIFHAMNLMFASARTPLHWELLMNGNRPTALLRVLAEPKSSIDPTTGLPVLSLPAPLEKPMVFFVGDLIGDEKSGKMTMDQLVQTVGEVCKMGIGGDHILSHRQAQLLIVRGSGDDITFVQNTLSALREKVRLAEEQTGEQTHKALKSQVESGGEHKAQGTTGETKPRSDATKAP